MSPIKFLFPLVLCILLTACSFDSMYLHPHKIPADAEKVSVYDRRAGEQLTAEIGENFQPTFLSNSGDTADLAFEIESVLFGNNYGNTLNGWIMRPDSGYNGTTLLFFHGNAGNLFNHYNGVVPFVERGFKVFIFDYSGFGFSEGKASRDNVLRDANAALGYFLNRADLERAHLVLYGQSLGGHLAAVIAGQNQDKIDGLVVEGAFSSHGDIAASSAGFLGRILVAEKYSGLEAIGQYRKPLLVIHSPEDRTVPFELGKKLYDSANDPKSFLEIENCHICGPLYYADTIVSEINKMTRMGIQ